MKVNREDYDKLQEALKKSAEPTKHLVDAFRKHGNKKRVELTRK